MKKFDEMINLIKEDSTVPDSVTQRVEVVLSNLPEKQKKTAKKGRKNFLISYAAVAIAAVIAAVIILSVIIPQKSGQAGAFSMVVYGADEAHAASEQSAEGKVDDLLFYDYGGKYVDGFTYCMFKITGQNIREVTCYIDKCELYEYRIMDIPSELAGDYKGMLTYSMQLGYRLLDVRNFDTNPQGEFARVVGKKYTYEYSEDIAIGFHVPDEILESPERLALLHENPIKWKNANLREFNGATVTVVVTFLDGKTETQQYTIHTKTDIIIDGKESSIYGIRGERKYTMSPIVIVLLCAGAVLAALVIILIKKDKRTGAVILGVVCAITFATALYLDNYRQSTQYNDQSLMSYLTIQDDPHLKGYRIVVNGSIVTKYPEYDPENPLTYRIDENMGEIQITQYTNLDSEEEYQELVNNDKYKNYMICVNKDMFQYEWPEWDGSKKFSYYVNRSAMTIFIKTE